MNFKDFREQIYEVASQGTADPAYLKKLLRGVKVSVNDKEVPVSLSRVLRGISIFNKTGRMQSIPQNILPHYDAFMKKQNAVSSKFANRASQVESVEEVSNVIVEKMDDPPQMLVLKRVGIRIFPDGRRVALYTDTKLGLTFSIPYDENFGTAIVPGVQPK